MRCFNHPSNDAAGVCRNCGRGLCSDCIVFAEDAVACKGACEARVAAIQRIMQSNPTTYRTAAGQYYRAGVNGIFMGLLFVAMGGMFVQFAAGDFGSYLGALFIGLGLLVSLNGMNTLWTSRKYKRIAADASDRSSTSR